MIEKIKQSISNSHKEIEKYKGVHISYNGDNHFLHKFINDKSVNGYEIRRKFKRLGNAKNFIDQWKLGLAKKLIE